LEHANVSRWINVPIPAFTAEEKQSEAARVKWEKRHSQIKTQIAAIKGEMKKAAQPADAPKLVGIVVDDEDAVFEGNSTQGRGHVIAGFPRRRLDAESLRDTMLLVSGELDLERPAPILKDAERAKLTSRSVYAPIGRNHMDEFFEVFDFPDPNLSSNRRTSNPIPTQALYLMNPYGFTVFLAGGGVKSGYRHGSTDQFGHRAETGRVHMHDLHATILHLLGLDHERLTYRHAGRDFRLTDVHGEVAHNIIA
jgi:hypothetical protein